MKEPLCNFCDQLVSHVNERDSHFFKASCGAYMIATEQVRRPRVIDCYVHEGEEIERPMWCPCCSDTNSKQIDQDNESKEEKKEFKELSYSEKKDISKQLHPIINWKDIKVDGIYVIPAKEQARNEAIIYISLCPYTTILS